ncbi:hypothetical protein [Paenibacillus agilis]|uniref:Uncharacterized protein n=1 Tax=Paenibacillus agilis TaxID=3020863 RepID=A0A559IF04_9BACL|nr:hypothetical protein [Paenibacillus agilis]TVX86053.1 hypothetical protein FPZ44_24230 [Paenibacillus agilis]
MQNKVMEIVKRICDTQSNCKGLSNNQQNISELLALKGINESEINVYEMPINWGNQALICYEVKATNEHRELFAGIGNDGIFYFEDGEQEE